MSEVVGRHDHENYKCFSVAISGSNDYSCWTTFEMILGRNKTFVPSIQIYFYLLLEMSEGNLILLPEETLLELLVATKGEAIFNLCRVNSTLGRICDDERLWGKKISLEYQVASKSEKFGTWKELYKLLLSGAAKVYLITLAGQHIDTTVFLKEETIEDVVKQMQEYQRNVQDYYRMETTPSINPYFLTPNNQIGINKDEETTKMYNDTLRLTMGSILKSGKFIPSFRSFDGQEGFKIRKRDGEIWRKGYAIEVGRVKGVKRYIIPLRISFTDRKGDHYDIWPYMDMNKDTTDTPPRIGRATLAYYLGVFQAIDPEIKSITFTVERINRKVHIPSTDQDLEISFTAKNVQPISIILAKDYTETELDSDIFSGKARSLSPVVATATY